MNRSVLSCLRAAWSLALVSLLLSLSAPASLAQVGGPVVAPAWLDELLPEAGLDARAAALAELVAAPDPRAWAPLLDVLRHEEDWERAQDLLEALEAVTGEPHVGVRRVWESSSRRLGETNAPALPPGYLSWKARLLAQAVDPEYLVFLDPRGVPQRLRAEEIVWGGVGPQGLPPLEDPETLSASEAELDDDEPVFGVVLGGEARAYPLSILDWHEMVNDVVGGVPIALAWCTLCGAGVPYRAERDGERMRFASSGLLQRSNKLMFDRATRTLWNQLTGEAVLGPLAAAPAMLEPLPGVTTSWAAWRARHPETRVLSPRTGHDRDYELGASYGEYFASAETMFPVPGLAAELAAKEQLFVLRDGEHVVGFRLATLRAAGGVLHARVAERELLVVLLPPDATPGGLPPRANRGAQAERALAHEVRAYAVGTRRFQPLGEGSSPTELRDAAGARWALREDALHGPAGERLPRLAGHLVFRLGWEAFFADAELR